MHRLSLNLPPGGGGEGEILTKFKDSCSRQNMTTFTEGTLFQFPQNR